MATTSEKPSALAALAALYHTSEDRIAHELVNARIRRQVDYSPLDDHELRRLERHLLTVSLPVPRKQEPPARKTTANLPPKRRKSVVLSEENLRAIVAVLKFSDHELLPWVLHRKMPNVCAPKLLNLKDGVSARSAIERKIVAFLQSDDFGRVTRRIRAELRAARDTHGAELERLRLKREALDAAISRPKGPPATAVNLPERRPLFDWETWREQP